MRIFDVKAKGTTIIDTYTMPASGVGYLRMDADAILTWDPGATPEPAGSDKQIQFNDAGVMGGNASLVFDKTTGVLSVGGGIWIKEQGSSPTYYTKIITGDQSYDITYTLPAASGAALTFLQNNGTGVLSWTAVPETNPGGSDTHIQYNDGGVFGGDAGLTYDNIADLLSVANISTTGYIAVSGSDAEVLFNDGGIIGSDSAFTFDKTANLLSVTNITTTGSIAISGSDTQVLFIDEGVISSDSGLTYDKVAELLAVANITTTGSIAISGSNREILFNDAGVISSDSGLTYDKAATYLSIDRTANAGDYVGAALLNVALNFETSTDDGEAYINIWQNTYVDSDVTHDFSWLVGIGSYQNYQGQGSSGYVLSYDASVNCDAPSGGTINKCSNYYAFMSFTGGTNFTTIAPFFSDRGSIDLSGGGEIDRLGGLILDGWDYFSGTIDNAYGVYIGDISSIPATNNYNIYSAGATSMNYFEGLTRMGGTVAGHTWQNPWSILAVHSGVEILTLGVTPSTFVAASYDLTATQQSALCAMMNVYGSAYDGDTAVAAQAVLQFDGDSTGPELYALSSQTFISNGQDEITGGQVIAHDVINSLMFEGTGTSTFTTVALIRAGNVLYTEGILTIANIYGVLVSSPLDAAGGGVYTITNVYGIHIEDQLALGVNNYNIYSAGATSKNFFEGYGYFGSTPVSHYFSTPQLSVINTDGDLTSIFIGSSGTIGINSVVWDSSGGFGIVTMAVSTEDGSMAVGTISTGYVLQKNGSAYGILSNGIIDDQLGEIPNGVAIGSSPDIVVKSVNNYNVWASNVRGLDVGAFSSFEQSGSGTLSIENYYGISIRCPSVTGTVGIDNVYGFYIEDYSSLSASGSNYNLYSAGATSKNYFEGDVEIGGDLDVSTGSIAISGSDTQILFIDEGVISSVNDFTWAKATRILTIQDDDDDTNAGGITFLKNRGGTGGAGQFGDDVATIDFKTYDATPSLISVGKIIAQLMPSGIAYPLTATIGQIDFQVLNYPSHTPTLETVLQLGYRHASENFGVGVVVRGNVHDYTQAQFMVMGEGTSPAGLLLKSGRKNTPWWFINGLYTDNSYDNFTIHAPDNAGWYDPQMYMDDTGLTVLNFGHSAIATGPTLQFRKGRNYWQAPSDGVDEDEVGTISFKSYDDGTPTLTEYGKLFVQIVDASDTTEAGRMTFSTMAAGTLTEAFRIESGVLTLYDGAATATAKTLQFTKSRGGAGQDGDDIGTLSFKSYNDAGTPELIEYAKILAEIGDASDTTEDGKLTISLMKAGSLTDIAVFDNTATYQTVFPSTNILFGASTYSGTARDIIFRQPAAANLNVKFSSAVNTSLEMILGIDASTFFFWDDVAARYVATFSHTTKLFNLKNAFQLDYDTSSSFQVIRRSNDATGLLMDLRQSRQVSGIAEDVVVQIDMVGLHTGVDWETFGQIKTQIVTPTSGSEDGRMVFSSVSAGTLTEAFRVASGVFTIYDGTNTATAKTLQFTKSRGAAGQDGDDIGTISFKSYNDAGTPELIEFMNLRAEIVDASDSTEDGVIKITTMSRGTAHTDSIRLGSVWNRYPNNDNAPCLEFGLQSAGSSVTSVLNFMNDYAGTAARVITSIYSSTWGMIFATQSYATNSPCGFQFTTNGDTANITMGAAASYRLYCNFFNGTAGNIGTSADQVIGIFGPGIAPTTLIADSAWVWSADYNGVAGDTRLYFMSEANTNKTIIGKGGVECLDVVNDANALNSLVFTKSRSGTGAAGQDGDDIGTISFKSYNDAGTPALVEYAKIVSEIGDSDATYPVGRMSFFCEVANDATAYQNILILNPYAFRAGANYAAIAELGQMYVGYPGSGVLQWGVGWTHDGSSSKIRGGAGVGFNLSSWGGFAFFSTAAGIDGASVSGQRIMQWDYAGSNIYFGANSHVPQVTAQTVYFDVTEVQYRYIDNNAVGNIHTYLKSRGAAGQDGDDIGTISFKSYNDNATPALTEFASITAEILDASDINEYGTLKFSTTWYGTAGAAYMSLGYGASSDKAWMYITTSGYANLFAAKIEGYNGLAVNGTNAAITTSGTTPLTGVMNSKTGSTYGIYISSSGIDFTGNSASLFLGYISTVGNNTQKGLEIRVDIGHDLWVPVAGNLIYLDTDYSNTGRAFTGNLFYAEKYTSELFKIDYNSDVSIWRRTADAVGHTTTYTKSRATSGADADDIGTFSFKSYNDAWPTPELIEYAKMTVTIEDASDSTEDALVTMTQMRAGTATTGNIQMAITKTDTGDPSAGIGYEGLMCINTFDNNVKIYADGAWRSVVSW